MEVNTTHTGPLNSDTDGDGVDDDEEDPDGDGLSNAVEVNTIHTDPLLVDTDGDGVGDGEEDSDGDGLSNAEEVNTTHTDPRKPDTDGDGLGDGVEVNTTHTDPRKPDTDGDGLGDGVEVNTTHTDPRKPDTDGDGLGDGVEVNTTHTGPLNSDTDGDGVDDDEEDPDGDGLSNAVEVNTIHTDPLLLDTDGDSVADGEEDSDGDQLDNGFEIALQTAGYPCLSPGNFDSDGDLLPDGWEYSTGLDPCNLNSTTNDIDGDGLLNIDEYRYCADPFNPDTDGDGAMDGAEVPHSPGSNPNDPDDQGDPANCVTLSLTVGDPSGSHSERWVFIVEDVVKNADIIHHVDDGFGTPGTKEYSLVKGKRYRGRIEWVASLLSPPDYDWRAKINGSIAAGVRDGLYGTGCFWVGDPDHMLAEETHGNENNIVQGREIDINVLGITGDSFVCMGGVVALVASGGNAPYTWTSSDASIATVNSSGEVTGVAPGIVIITATDYNGCSAQKEIVILKVEMTRPDDKATSRYFHNDYDDSTPGVCDVSCNVDISPNTSEIRSELQGKVHWSIDGISGSTLSWQNGSSGVGLGVYEPAYDDWREKAIYTGLPSDNDEFGEKNVTVTIDSLGCSQSGKTKVFFGRDDKNHPGPDSGSTPNWFYYWPQGAVGGGLDDFEYGGDSLDINGKYISSTDTLYIYGGAVVPQVAHNVTHKTNSTLQFTIGVSASGIDFVAAVVLHEKKHKWIYNNWATLPDTDGDGVPDSEENCAPYYFDKNDADSYNLGQVIHPNYFSYGDQEFLCRMAEQGYVSDSTKDWANPGKQWTYGITEY